MVCGHREDGVGDVREQVEDVMQLAGDLLVHRQLAGHHLGSRDHQDNK